MNTFSILQTDWTVTKRSGQSAAFDAHKITQAILKAGDATKEVDSNQAYALTLDVLDSLHQQCPEHQTTVEAIQDTVERILMQSPYPQTAKAYILYRAQHARMREMIAQNNVALIDQYLQSADWTTKENSNMHYSLQGLNHYVSTEISKSYWLNAIYPPEIRQAHLSGDFHLHDLGELSVYCVGWDLQALLLQGFGGVPGKVASLPAKHFRSALGQIVNFFYTLQGESAGAQAFANFDTLLAPFIAADNLSDAEIRQCLQEFVFNINVPTRVGFQSPFTNLTFDLVVPEYLAKQPAIIGGEPIDKPYGAFQAEMDRLNRAFLEVMQAGDASHRVFSFPIPTYNITKNFDWDNHNLDLLWEVTAKYGIPYFANFVNSNLSPDDARSMCCRLRIDNRELLSRGGGLFGANPLTGSIGVVTINLPRLGYVARDTEHFLSLLTERMLLAKNSLEIKRKTLEKFTAQGLYPYARVYLKTIKDRFDTYWHNHFSTIGIVGMQEASLLLQDCGIDTAAGRLFAEQVLDHMRDVLQRFQAETGHLYNLEATPAESTSYRLSMLDAKQYPEMPRQLKRTNAGYTNSSQLPVDDARDIFTQLSLQDSIQSKYTGGTVQHIFLGEAVADPKAVRHFIRKVCTQFTLPYLSITPTFSICDQHGYLRGKHKTCPTCCAKTEIYSRVVGYLRPVDQWHAGKQQEFDKRTLHVIDAADRDAD